VSSFCCGDFFQANDMAIVHSVTANVLGKPEVAFDEHAVKRMAERAVSEAQVMETLQSPDVTGLRADPGRQRVRRNYGLHSAVDVVFEEEPFRIVVITVMRRTK
jgi:hypothetical protein